MTGTQRAPVLPRVLVVYQHLPHYRYGVFRALQEDQRLDVHFAAGNSSQDGSIRVLNETHLENVTWLSNKWHGGVLWQRGLNSLIRKGAWDSVVFLGDAHYASTWTAAFTARLRRIPVHFWTIGWHRIESGPKKYFRFTFYRIADSLLLYGDSAKTFGTTMGFDGARMNVIYNSSFSPGESAELYTPKAPSRSPFIIGCIIRLNPQKELHLTIRAAQILRMRGLDVEVEIHGDGPAREELELLARELSVPLSLPGAVYDPQEIERFYDRISVAVIPSLAGLSATQSLRYGRPVISHDNMEEQAPESEAIRPGLTGDFYRRGSVDDLANKIQYWVGRQSTGASETAVNCHEEVTNRWSPVAQANAIVKALCETGGSLRHS